VELCQVPAGQSLKAGGSTIVGVVKGELETAGFEDRLRLEPGRFCFLPAVLGDTSLTAASAAELLVIRPR
jgi:hypothetical protein